MFDELGVVGKILYILFFPLLWVISLLYSFITSVRNLLFDLNIRKSRVVGSRVISVGNIDVGGTGKTPVTIRLASYLTGRGYTTVVLTRGYHSGLKSDEGIWIKEGKIYPLCMGDSSRLDKLYPDEPRLISAKVPGCYVVVGADRSKMADLFLKQTGKSIDWWILDDGFQHRKIHRDIDIVLLDSKRPLSCNCIPCGRRREKISSLKRADVLLFTRSLEDKLSVENKKISDKFRKKTYPVVFKAGDFLHIDRKSSKISGVVDRSFFEGKSIGVISAIAKNKQFLSFVADTLGMRVEDIYYSCCLKDHSKFKLSNLDLNKIQNSGVIVTTGKDYFRDPDFFNMIGTELVVLDLDIGLTDSVIEGILVKK